MCTNFLLEISSNINNEEIGKLVLRFAEKLVRLPVTHFISYRFTILFLIFASINYITYTILDRGEKFQPQITMGSYKERE